MKLYIVNNSKLRNAISNKAKEKKVTFSAILESTGAMSNSVVRKAELRFDKYSGNLDFEPDMFTSYAIYYADIYEEICKILGLDMDLLLIQEIKKEEPVTVNSLAIRVRELEDRLLTVMEELQKIKEA